MSKSLRTIIKGAGIVSIGMIASKIFAYIYRILVARMGVEDYGLLMLGLAFMGFVLLFSRFGMNVGLLKYISTYKSRDDKTKIMQTVSSVIIFALIKSIMFATIGFIFAETISNNIFHNSALTKIIKILMISVPFNVMTTMLLSIATAFKKVEYEVIAMNFVEGIVKIIITIILIYFGLKIMGATYSFSLSIITAFFVTLYFVVRMLKGYKIVKCSMPQLKVILAYSFPLLLSGVAISIFSWTDTFMLGYFNDTYAVGIYNAMLPLANLLYIVPFCLMALFIPVMEELYEKKKYKDQLEFIKLN